MLEKKQTSPKHAINNHCLAYNKTRGKKKIEQWSENIRKKVSSFKGFKGKYMVPPKKGATINEYPLLFSLKT